MWTLTSGKWCWNKVIINDNHIRYLIENECELLHWFPKDYTKFGIYNWTIKEVAQTHRYYQLGNTISVKVLEEIIKNLLL